MVVVVDLDPIAPTDYLSTPAEKVYNRFASYALYTKLICGDSRGEWYDQKFSCFSGSSSGVGSIGL